MGFLEMHHWRRMIKVKHPRLAPGPIRYSRGQLAHGDMLYFRDPDKLPDDSPEAISRLLQMAFLAIAHEHVDHAAFVLRRPAVAAYPASNYGEFDLEAALGQASRSLLRAYRRRRLKQSWLDLKGMIGRQLGIIE